MKFLIDQDVYAGTARFISTLGHDVVRVGSIGLAQAEDEKILSVAQKQGRILVTRDRDFGNLVFLRSLGAGVLYLRIMPTTQAAVHKELERVLNSYSQQNLAQSFVVIGPGGHRIRKLSGS